MTPRKTAALSEGASSARADEPLLNTVPAPENPMHAAILAVIRRIPRGRVCTYGRVATLAGCTGRARLVGQLLKQAGAEAALPWHRVLGAGGRIVFAAQTAPWREQSRRLRTEGVGVKGGRVSLPRYGWPRASSSPLLD